MNVYNHGRGKYLRSCHVVVDDTDECLYLEVGMSEREPGHDDLEDLMGNVEEVHRFAFAGEHGPAMVSILNAIYPVFKENGLEIRLEKRDKSGEQEGV